jgi:hypothetical protein
MFEWMDGLVSGVRRSPSEHHRGSARTGRPGRASGTIEPSRTTKAPLTRTCRIPADGRVLSE